MKDLEHDAKVMNAYKNMKPREDVTVEQHADIVALKKLESAYERMYNPPPKQTYEEFVSKEIANMGEKFTFMQPEEKLEFYTNCEVNFKG